MLIKVIKRVHGQAVVECLVHALSYNRAVRIAFPVGDKVARIDMGKGVWHVHLKRTGTNTTYPIIVWCMKATDADSARYETRAQV